MTNGIVTFTARVSVQTRRTGSRAARWTLTAQKVQSSGAQALSTDRKCSRMSCCVLPSPRRRASSSSFSRSSGRRRNEIWLVRRRDSLLTQVLTRREEVVFTVAVSAIVFTVFHAVLASLIWCFSRYVQVWHPEGDLRGYPCGVSPRVAVVWMSLSHW